MWHTLQGRHGKHAKRLEVDQWGMPLARQRSGAASIPTGGSISHCSSSAVDTNTGWFDVCLFGFHVVGCRLAP